jgi:hypothetical protein
VIVLFACGGSKLRLAAKRGGDYAGKASQLKTKENLGNGSGDAQPNPKPYQNLDLRSLRPLPKERKAGSGVKKAEAPKQLRPAAFEDLSYPRPLPRKPGEQGENYVPGLSEELQQRESDYVARVNAWLANSTFTEKEKQGHKERLIDILDTQDTQVAMLKDLSWVREDMQRAGFDHPVEWLISQGEVIPAPPGFHRFRPPMSLWRRELHQLYRDKVKEVVHYWREQGFI